MGRCMCCDRIIEGGIGCVGCRQAAHAFADPVMIYVAILRLQRAVRDLEGDVEELWARLSNAAATPLADGDSAME